MVQCGLSSVVLVVIALVSIIYVVLMSATMKTLEDLNVRYVELDDHNNAVWGELFGPQQNSTGLNKTFPETVDIDQVFEMANNGASSAAKEVVDNEDEGIKRAQEKILEHERQEENEHMKKPFRAEKALVSLSMFVAVAYTGFTLVIASTERGGVERDMIYIFVFVASGYTVLILFITGLVLMELHTVVKTGPKKDDYRTFVAAYSVAYINAALVALATVAYIFIRSEEPKESWDAAPRRKEDKTWLKWISCGICGN